MFFKGRENTRDLESYRDITDDVEESDFVPYACLFDAHTIITKNGELLQTIKITGDQRDNLGAELPELRDALRAAIRNNISSDSYAIWFHTLRRNQDLSTDGDFKSSFAKEVSDTWEHKHDFKNQFINEVYITIVHEGQSAKILNPSMFLRGLIPSKDIKWRNSYLDTIHLALNKVVESISDELKPFGARRLGLVERDGVYCSESLQFMEKLTNLVDRSMPLPMEDLSEYLTSGEITFGYNAMEVRTHDGRRRFASILTIKEYKEASLGAIDKFLQAPIEFIVTQCVDFINPEKALEQYKEQKEFYSIGDADELAAASELDAIIASNRGSPVDFGQQQLSVFIQADSVKQLESYSSKAIQYLSEYGIIAFREDIKFEECYWSQLPGNFEFISRLTPTNTAHIAGFANLYNFPVGVNEGNHWGGAVVSFHTAMGTPYFFNFHNQDNGHTTIIGPYGSGKSVCTNFLVSHSMKFNPKIYYFDLTASCEGFVSALGGVSYDFSDVAELHVVGENTKSPSLNPFKVNITAEYRAFLISWLSVMTQMTDNAELDFSKLVEHAVDSVFAMSLEERGFSAFINAFAAICPEHQGIFDRWKIGGEFGSLFNGEADIFEDVGDVIGFNLKSVLSTAPLFIPLASYLLQRITMQLDANRPEIIVMDEAWRLLKDTHISADMSGWMDYLTRKNAIGIYTTEYIEESGSEPINYHIMNGAVTNIFLPDDEPSEIYQNKFGVSDIEYSYIGAMDLEQRNFLLKQAGSVTIAEMNLSGMDDIIKVLSGSNVDNTHEVVGEQSVAV